MEGEGEPALRATDRALGAPHREAGGGAAKNGTPASVSRPFHAAHGSVLLVPLGATRRCCEFGGKKIVAYEKKLSLPFSNYVCPDSRDDCAAVVYRCLLAR